MFGIPAFIEHFHYPGLFTLLIHGGIGLPFPEDGTLILCGFLISMKTVLPVPALIVVYTGLLTSDLLIHLFGKKYGQKIVSHKKFQKFISPERLQLIENKFNRFGLLLILAGRHIAGLRAQIFLVSGVMKMPTLKFLLADALSSIFTIIIMVGAGYIGGNSLNIIKKDMAKIGHIAILLILATLTAYLIFRYFKAKRQ